MPPYPPPVYRKLKGYAFDPSFSSTLNKRKNNEVLYKIDWEPTTSGPVGTYVEVMDYDPTKKSFYSPVFLDDPHVLADHGLEPSEGDPRFHQQQVYAVIMNVISQFEKALGRKITWSKIVDIETDERHEYRHVYIDRLRIYPHAMRQQNAYFSPEKNALLFGYFMASNSWHGNNVPGTTIFTCLSPDIVAHEVTHAILHSIHPYLTTATNPDMLAFHEGFADIIALLQRFTFRQVVEEQIRNSRGDLLSPENLLGDLAIQFGQAVSSNRRALRSFLVTKDEQGNWTTLRPDPTKYNTVMEPHGRGAILVAAVFDAFASLYRYKVADLIRIASNGSGILAAGEISPDLVSRLSSEACEIAEKIMKVCIRALDYCPPTDLTFGDYLRALVTADLDHNPDDEEGIRYAIMESFRRWGIVPEDVNDFSVEALAWKSPDEYFVNGQHLASLKRMIKFAFDPDFVSGPRGPINDRINSVTRSIERIFRENDRRKIFDESQELAAMVHDLFGLGIAQNGVERLLGMDFNGIIYNYQKVDENGVVTKISLKAAKRDKFQVYKCRPIIIPDAQKGHNRKIMLIMFLQKVYVSLRGSKFQGYFKDDIYPFRGGASLVIDMSNYEIEYVISKKICSAERLVKQLEYAAEHGVDALNAALMMQSDEPFAALHVH